MTEILKKPDQKVTSWLEVAIGIGIIAAIFIGWHFSEYSLKTSALANQQRLVIERTEATYNNLQ